MTGNVVPMRRVRQPTDRDRLVELYLGLGAGRRLLEAALPPGELAAAAIAESAAEDNLRPEPDARPPAGAVVEALHLVVRAAALALEQVPSRERARLAARLLEQ